MAGKRKPSKLVTTFATYTVGQVIGEGGAGRVFTVEDEDGKPCAAKILNIDRITSERQKRFRNEIDFCQRRRHRNIVEVVDHGILATESGVQPFYVMPLYDGSLRGRMTSSIPKDRVLHYFAQMLNGVEAAHIHGVVHRDIKPENFLYSKADDSFVLADFGIAHFRREELLTLVETRPTSRLANFQYAAPEQRKRGEVVGAAADIYALGLMLNELFTGSIPVGTGYATIGNRHPDLGYLDELVDAMLRQTPENRLASIEEVKRKLIAMGNDFVRRQRLSELDGTVVEATSIDDSMLSDPPRLIDFEWGQDRLTLILSRPLNPRFVWAIQHLGNYTSVMGKGPETFNYKDDKAIVSARENQVQALVTHFKMWLDRARGIYEERLRTARLSEERAERERLQAEREELEAQQRLRKSIKI